jgi:hypothetical protein
MPLRFRRRIRLAPGVTLNLNKRSISTSFGRRGAHHTVGPQGRRTTFGLPGTGLFYTTYHSARAAGPLGAAIVILVFLTVVIGFLIR